MHVYLHILLRGLEVPLALLHAVVSAANRSFSNRDRKRGVQTVADLG